MKKLVYVLVGVFLFSTTVGAVNASVSVVPSSPLWLSEDFELAAICEPTSGTYTVYVENITRGDNQAHAGAGSALEFIQDGNEYILDGNTVKTFLDERYSYTPGKYTFFTTCDGDGSSDTEKQTFTVETLVAEIQSGLSSGTYFAGEETNVSLVLKKEGEGSPEIIGGNADPRPTFTVSADGESLPVSSYYRANDRSWVLNTDMPGEPGEYTLELTAGHDGAATTLTRDITVQDALQFDASLSTTTVSSGKTITLDVSAVHQGDELSLTADDLNVMLAEVDIMDNVVMQDGTTASVTVPELTPGTYELVVELDKDGVPSASHSFTLQYPVDISGAFTDKNDNPLSYGITFTQDGQRRKRMTGNGEYSTRLTPGLYNVTLDFNDAQLTFRNVDVTKWDDPVRYASYGRDAAAGMRLAGMYSYRTALTYDTAELSLRYDGGVVNDPQQLGVYYCSGWNSDRQTCYDSWSEVSADRDEVNNRMSLQAAGEGVYAIGRRSALTLTYNADEFKSSYTPDGSVELSGRVKGPDGNAVSNASVAVNVPGTDISTRTWTDNRGMFSVTFGVPEDAGSYTVDVTAEKSPYRESGTSIDFSVERPASIDIVAPESVRARANTTKNVSLYIENTGYTEITDLKPVTDDVPFLKRISFDGRPLQSGETRDVSVTLAVPADASAKTYKAELAFTYADQKSTNVFGITVEELESTNTGEQADADTTSGMVAGKLSSLPSMLDVSNPLPEGGLPFMEIILFIVALQVGVVAVVLTRGKVTGGRGTRRDDVLRSVADIKEEVDRFSREKGRSQVQDGNQRGVGAPSMFRRRGDDVERENVIRAMDHIKEQLASNS